MLRTNYTRPTSPPMPPTGAAAEAFRGFGAAEQGPALTPVISELLGYITRNVRYPLERASFSTESEMWERRPLSIVLSPKIRPSEAIVSMLNSKSFLECERTALLSTYFLLLRKIGPRRFDQTVKDLKIVANFNFTKIPQNLKAHQEFVHLRSFDEVKIGDWLYIENSEKYRDIHPGGAASGEHVICSSVLPLTFIGLLHKTEPLSYEAWLDMLLKMSPGIKISEMKGVLKRDGMIIAKRLKD